MKEISPTKYGIIVEVCKPGQSKGLTERSRWPTTERHAGLLTRAKSCPCQWNSQKARSSR